ncbi:MAG: hypothetical protein M1820_005566 [Bogoriella megaspora]|nr:MAG: hypothetical protein M1820_005566 [Bogoriella megaspora]
MSTQIVLPNAPVAAPVPSHGPLTVEANFKIASVDRQLELKPSSELFHLEVTKALQAAKQEAPLGVLDSFRGTFAGSGFNVIWRPKPQKGGPDFTTPVNINALTKKNLIDDNVLELNLTKEKLQFFDDLNQVPNRGLFNQPDIVLNGVPYNQSIENVTNPKTGLADLPTLIGQSNAIHFEPGLWMHVPASVNPPLDATLSRMASIPHGTTLNAQGKAPTRGSALKGQPPSFPPVDITPFDRDRFRFPGQDAATKDSSRLPQNLSPFIQSGTITQKILDDPNEVLRAANQGKKFIDTETFTVSTSPAASDFPTSRAGISNISFLAPNADAVEMTSTFWVSTVQHQLEVPKWNPKLQGDLILAPSPPSPKADVPIFRLTLKGPILKEKTVTVFSKQIQYSQTVMLKFGGITWPHVSVATLVPADVLNVPDTILDSLK